jgi:hypothetical protein
MPSTRAATLFEPTSHKGATPTELHEAYEVKEVYRSQAHSPHELWRAADRAEGFVLGLETVKALNPDSLEGLYLAFDIAATARRLEHEQ